MPSPLAPLDRRELEPVRAGRTLPATAYTSPDVLAWELDRFFDRSWVAVGRSSAPEGQRATRAGTEGILLVRDAEGALRAFYNVCRHRGHELLAPGGATSRGHVRCPYHGWSYGLDGSLLRAPQVDPFPGADAGLVPVPLVEWHGWAFVNPSADAPSFTEHIGNLDDIVAPYQPAELVVSVSQTYDVEANWKLIVENYHECYHCSSIHPQLCRVSPPSSGTGLDATGAWVGGPMALADHVETMSFNGRSEGAFLPGLSPRQRREVQYVGLFPNLLMSLHPDYVMTHLVEPVTDRRSRVTCQWLFHPDAVGREGFDPRYATDFWDLTNRQDFGACESLQRGVSSRGYRSGPLSRREGDVRRFLSLVADGYLGPDDR